MFYRFLIFNSVTAFLAAYLYQYHGALDWLLNNDHTYISLVIAAVYVLTSGYLGYNIFQGKEGKDKHIGFISRMLLGLGLIGTVIGMMIIFQNSGDIGEKSGLLSLMKGVGVAQITTLFGLSAGWLLDLQNWISTGSVGDER